MKVYTKELKEKAIAEFKKGKTYSDISQEFKIPAGTVHNWVMRDRAGMEIHPTSSQNISIRFRCKSQAIEDFKQGMSRADICKKYQVGYSTLFSWTKNTRVRPKKYESEKDTQAPLFNAPTWISVDEKVPDHEKHVLVTAIRTYIPNPSNPSQATVTVVRTGYHKWVKHECNCGSCDQKKSQWYIPDYPLSAIKVTHWMELPEKPKEKEVK